VLLLNKTVIEDCKRDHAMWRGRLDAFVAIVEKARWRTPVDLKAGFGSADAIGGNLYAIDVGGKKGLRVIIIVQFVNETVIVDRIFTDHDEYVAFSSAAKATLIRNRNNKSKIKNQSTEKT